MELSLCPACFLAKLEKTFCIAIVGGHVNLFFATVINFLWIFFRQNVLQIVPSPRHGSQTSTSEVEISIEIKLGFQLFIYIAISPIYDPTRASFNVL